GDDAIIAWVSLQAQEQLHRKIVVKDATISLTRGLTFVDFKISDHPDFMTGTFVSGERLIIRPNLLRLLLGQVDVETVILDNAQVSLSRSADGKFSIDDLIGVPVVKPKAMSIDEKLVLRLPKVGLNISLLRLVGGRMTFKDMTGTLPDVTAEAIDFSLKDFSLESPFDMEFSARAEFDLSRGVISKQSADSLAHWRRAIGRRAQVAFGGRINLAQGLVEAMDVTVDEFKAATDLWSVQAKGRMSSAGEPWINLDAVFGFNNYDTVVAKLPMHLNGEGKLKLEIPGTQPLAYRVILDAKGLDVDWDIWIAKSQGRELLLDAKATQVELRSSAQGPYFGLKGAFTLKAGDAPAAGSDDWSLFVGPDPHWRLRISSGTAYAHGALAVMPIFKDYRLSGGEVLFDALTADVNAADVDFLLKRVRMRDGFLKEKTEDIGSVKAAMDFFRFVKKGKVEDFSFSCALEAHKADTEFFKADDLWVVADLKGIHPESSSDIDGSVHSHWVKGGLQNIPGFIKRAPFMEFLIKPITIMEDLHKWKVVKLDDHDFTTVPFDVMQADYYLDDGRMSLDSIDIRSGIGDLRVRGHVDFPRDDINLQVATTMPRSRVRWKLSDSFSDSKGNPYLTIKVKGNLNNPDNYVVLPDRKNKPGESLDGQREAMRAKVAAVFKRNFD
ncbi:MAG: hypothetical protein AABZ44_08605, partial [Elusimicrobiota bacterium]